jgi:hypothetical protein
MKYGIGVFLLGCTIASPASSGICVPQIGTPFNNPILLRAQIFAKEGQAPGDIVDGRWNLSQVREKLGINLTPRQVSQFKACVGEITCKGKTTAGFKGSAQLVVRQDIVITSGHLLADNPEPFSADPAKDIDIGTCVFRNFLNRKVAIPLLAKEIEEVLPWAKKGTDYLVLRLKAKVKECQPFDVDWSDKKLPYGTKLLAVMGDQQGLRNNLSKNEPVVSRGVIREVTALAPSLFYTDIDSDHGASGGGAYVIGENGALVTNDSGGLTIRGMMVSGALSSVEGKPYKKKLGDFSDDDNWSGAIGVDGSVLALLQETMDRADGKKKPTALDDKTTIALTCKVSGGGQTAEFTIDVPGKRYKVVENGSPGRPDDDGSKWHKFEVVKDVIWWESKSGHFELDIAAKQGYFLGDNANVEYNCD